MIELDCLNFHSSMVSIYICKYLTYNKSEENTKKYIIDCDFRFSGASRWFPCVDDFAVGLIDLLILC
jgi:hypothetical protein